MAQTLDIPIGTLVPHESTMLLLDSMLEADEHGTVCLVKVHEQSTFLQAEGVPALIGIEYMAQAIAAHGGYQAVIVGDPVRVGFLLGTPKLTSHVSFFPVGSSLRVEVEKDWGDDEMLRFKCRILDQDSCELLMEAGLNVFQPRDLGSYLQRNHT